MENRKKLLNFHHFKCLLSLENSLKKIQPIFLGNFSKVVFYRETLLNSLFKSV